MKNLKSKIRDFLASEEGRVGVKTPLALGVAAGGLMLAQLVVSTPDAQADECNSNSECASGNCGSEWSLHLVGSYVNSQGSVVGIYKWQVHNVCK